MWRVILIVIGSISLGLGILGIFLPLLPTTPLLLLAAACYIRSSPRLYQWLINHKHLGPYITNWKQGNGIPRKAKVISILFIWISMLASAYVVPFLFMKFMFVFGASFFTWFIWRQKTLQNQ